MPSVPPYSSTTIAKCRFSLRISRQGGEHPRRARQLLHLADQVPDRRGAPGGVVGQQQVAHVHEADDVVLVAPGDRVPRPAGLRDLLGRPAGGHARLEEVDLGARGHHLAHLAVTGPEHLVDQPALVARQRLVRGDQVAELLLADRLPAGLRVPAEQPDEQVGGAGEEPDDRPEQLGDRVERRGHDQREALGPLQGQPLGGQLADHQRQVADRDGDRHEGQRVGEAAGQAEACRRPSRRAVRTACWRRTRRRRSRPG